MFIEEDDDGSTTPVWFARAAHDEVGADLRRRWDDPLLRREGDHPIIFAGAGSHAAYVEPGEYLQAVPLSLPPRVRSIDEHAIRRGGRDASDGPARGRPVRADRRRPVRRLRAGRRRGVGPGQPNAWTPILIDDDTPWVDGYRRPVRPRHRRPVRRRTRSGRAQVGPRRPPAPVVDRPGRLRRAGRDTAAGTSRRDADDRDRPTSAPRSTPTRRRSSSSKGTRPATRRACVDRPARGPLAAVRARRSPPSATGSWPRMRGHAGPEREPPVGDRRQRGRAGSAACRRPRRCPRPPPPRRPPAGSVGDPAQPTAGRVVGGRRVPCDPVLAVLLFADPQYLWVGLLLVIGPCTS